MMSPTEATEMILATAMAAAGQYSLQHAEIKDVLTVIFPNSVKTTSVLTGMDSLRGEAVMSEGDLEVWQSHVERLHHTITNDKEQRCWFITRRGDCFDVWHVPLRLHRSTPRVSLGAHDGSGGHATPGGNQRLPMP